jgi:5-(carboxyamino)imidazole ribonucleotide synthase
MRIGIIGGGQLGRMFIQNGLNYGHEFHVLDPDPEAPCSAIAHKFVCADRNDEEAVYQLGIECDVVTIEIENVSISGLKRIRDKGIDVYPQPEILEMIRDKGLQKQFYRDNHLPTADFALINSREEIKDHLHLLPVMQKMRIGGYDGKGVTPLINESDVSTALDAPSLLESWVTDATEIAVLVARNPDGDVKSFPVVELVFNPEANLVDYLVSPARISVDLEAKAREISENLVRKLDFVGLLAVEMFVTQSGEVLINEIAPRPHNSGHHTIEACFTSQYDQHLRSILNWPLGSTVLRSAAAMINLLGERGFEGPVIYEGLSDAISENGVYPHLYGKRITKSFRKMGHVTVLDNTTTDALAKAQRIKEAIRVIS